MTKSQQARTDAMVDALLIRPEISGPCRGRLEGMSRMLVEAGYLRMVHISAREYILRMTERGRDARANAAFRAVLGLRG